MHVGAAQSCSRIERESEADFPEEPLVKGRKCDTDSSSAIVNGVAK